MQKVRKNEKDTVYYQEQKNTRETRKEELLDSLFSIAFTMVGMYGAIFCFISGLGLAVNQKKLFGIMLLTVIIYTVLFRIKKLSILFLGIAFAGFAVTFFSYKNYIINGFYHLENIISIHFYKYTNVYLGQFIAEYDQSYCLELFLIILIQIAAVFFCAAIRYSSVKYICTLFLIAMVGVPLIVGIVPPMFPLVACITYFLLFFCIDLVPICIVKQSIGGKKEAVADNGERDKVQGISASILAAIIVLSMLMIGLLLPDALYSHLYKQEEKAAVVIEKAINDFDLNDSLNSLRSVFQDTFFSDDPLLFNTKSTNSGGLSKGNLKGTGNIKFKNKTALFVMVPETTNTLYLKGFTGAHYTGQEWAGLSEDERSRYDSIMQNKDGSGHITELNPIPYLKDGFGHITALNQIPYFFDYSLKMGTLLHTTFQNSIERSRIKIEYAGAGRDSFYVPYTFDYQETLAQNGFDQAVEVDDGYYQPLQEMDSYSLGYYNLDLQSYLRSGDIFRINKRNLDNVSDKVDLKHANYSIFSWMYDNFVSEVYVYVDKPDGTGRLDDLAWELLNKVGEPVLDEEYYNVSGRYTHAQILGMIDNVRNYMADETSYTLSPGKTPSDQDFAEYFLFENKKGYCMHYATAATLLLRAVGIPVRYVEGYVVTERDIINGEDAGEQNIQSYTIKDGSVNHEVVQMKKADIRDTNAHAWIEVYFDGQGWFPFEVTAGYSPDGILDSMDDSIYEAAGATPTPNPTKEPTKAPTEEPTKTPTKAPEEEISKAPDKTEAAPDPSKANTGIGWFFKAIIGFIATLTLLAGTVSLWYIWMTKRRCIRITMVDRRKAVLHLYIETERFLRRKKLKKKENESYLAFANRIVSEKKVPEEFITFIEAVLHSSFSEEEIIEENYTVALSVYKKLQNELYYSMRKQRIKYLWFKYVMVY